jgi:NAD(P)-dependent dehydrogenase (short-subunit alcohol dehydrogenase family)
LCRYAEIANGAPKDRERRQNANSAGFIIQTGTSMQSDSKVAIITGAGSGIGKRTAIALSREGYRVSLAGRREQLLRQTAAESGDEKRALVVPTDVTQPESVRNLFAKTVEAFGRVDLLFNNAGMGTKAIQIDELPVETWRAVVDVNLNGAFYCIQEAFRVMKLQSPQGGRIINNGSISAYMPRPQAIAYTATKHAITGLTRQVALDGRAFDIACGQIDIGNAATELAARMTTGALQADGTMAPEPTMDPEEVARAVVYMAGLPLSANVLFMTVMATKMKYVGRG